MDLPNRRLDHQLTRLALGLVLFLATALRCFRLGSQSLWSDEGNSVTLAQAGLTEIATRTALDIHPPLYYWLLHAWIGLFGTNEVAVRSLSVVVSVLAVAVTFALARRLFGTPAALVSSFLMAISPFQVHYAQETRMYALLGLLAVTTVLATAELVVGQPTARQESATLPPFPGNRLAFGEVSLRNWGFAVLYVAAATLGLYTHYALGVVLAATGIAGLVSPLCPRRPGWNRKLLAWIGLNLIPLVLFVPWLPTAWRQLTTWPAPTERVPWPDVLATIWRTLTLGPTAKGETVWLLLLGAAATLGMFTLLRQSRKPIVVLALLHLGLPTLLTLFLFKPAYLKFLLVAGPPLCLLLALATQALPGGHGSARKAGRLLILSAVLAVAIGSAWQALAKYYFDPTAARDDYRRLAAYVASLAGAHDAVLLDAPGQAEVFGYYYRGQAPVIPLPEQRPIDPAAATVRLEQLVDRAGTIYAVYWATDESDPQGLIEGWLDHHTFKAGDVWYGNVRLVTYASPLPVTDVEPTSARFGEQIELTGIRLSFSGEEHGEPRIRPGDIVQVQSRWKAFCQVPRDYTLFFQALDEKDHLAGQRDVSPVAATSTWRPGDTQVDRQGAFILPGTPPGRYRLILGMYEPDTGQRLPLTEPVSLEGADSFVAGVFVVERPDTPPPEQALAFRHPADQELGPLRLLGYDRYPIGGSYEPDTPTAPGTPVHVVAFWRAEERPPADWRVQLELTRRGEDAVLATGDYPTAGVEYPTSSWQAGEIVRAQYDLWLPADLQPGEYSLRLVLSDGKNRLPDGGFHLAPFAVN